MEDYNANLLQYFGGWGGLRTEVKRKLMIITFGLEKSAGPTSVTPGLISLCLFNSARPSTCINNHKYIVLVRKK